MSLRFWRAVAILGTLILISSASRAAPDTAQFRLYAEREEIPERGEVAACVVLTQGCRFRFLPPINWSIKGEATNRTVLLIPTDLSAGILFLLHPETNHNSVVLELDELRQRVRVRYPEAVLAREYTCQVAGSKAYAFDLVNQVPGNGQAALGFVFVPYAGGVAEVELRTTRDRFPTAKRHLSWFLNSLRIEPMGPEPDQPTGNRR